MDTHACEGSAGCLMEEGITDPKKEKGKLQGLFPSNSRFAEDTVKFRASRKSTPRGIEERSRTGSREGGDEAKTCLQSSKSPEGSRLSHHSNSPSKA